jgi:hypothetical protein
VCSGSLFWGGGLVIGTEWGGECGGDGLVRGLCRCGCGGA